MTTNQRERWETAVIHKVRMHLRKTLAIFRLMSADDKRDIEIRVMTDIMESVASCTDHTIEQKSSIPDFEWQSESLFRQILQERDLQRGMYE